MARARWAALHADITLNGYRPPAESTAPATAQEPERHRILLSTLPPLPQQPATDHAITPPPQQAPSDEDVCLL